MKIEELHIKILFYHLTQEDIRKCNLSKLMIKSNDNEDPTKIWFNYNFLNDNYKIKTFDPKTNLENDHFFDDPDHNNALKKLKEEFKKEVNKKINLQEEVK